MLSTIYPAGTGRSNLVVPANYTPALLYDPACATLCAFRRLSDLSVCTRTVANLKASASHERSGHQGRETTYPTPYYTQRILSVSG